MSLEENVIRKIKRDNYEICWDQESRLAYYRIQWHEEGERESQLLGYCRSLKEAEAFFHKYLEDAKEENA